MMVDPDGAGEAHNLAASDLAAYTATGALRIVTRAKLPVTASEEAQKVKRNKGRTYRAVFRRV